MDRWLSQGAGEEEEGKRRLLSFKTNCLKLPDRPFDSFFFCVTTAKQQEADSA